MVLSVPGVDPKNTTIVTDLHFSHLTLSFQLFVSLFISHLFEVSSGSLFLLMSLSSQVSLSLLSLLISLFLFSSVLSCHSPAALSP